MSPRFELAIFYFKPYPGNLIADQLLRDGYRFPQGLEEWANFDYVGSRNEWISNTQMRQVESFRFYQRIGWNDTMPLLSPVRKLARWRCQNHYYHLPLERRLYEWLRPPEKLS
jgi:hypothetical protein